MSSPRRFTLRLTLGTVVVGLLLLVAGGLVGAWAAIRRRAAEATAEALATEVSRGLSEQWDERLEAAEVTLGELADDARRGRLPVGDAKALEDRLVDRMRCERRFEWLAYVSAAATGAYVLRREDGTLLAARAGPGEPLSQETVARNGDRSPATSGLTSLEQVREGPWYALGRERTEPAWTALYTRTVDGSTGRAAAVSLREGDRVVGVFGIGYSTAFGSAVVADLWGDRAGGAALFNPVERRVGSASSPRAAGEWKPLLDAVAADLPRGVADLPEKGVRSWNLEHGGQRWVVACSRFGEREGLPAAMAVLLPEDALIGFLSRWRTATLVAAGALLAVAVAAALLVAHRIAKPLRAIAEDLESVGSFHLTDSTAPPSRIVEVAVLGDAAARMKRGLRSFSHYVPTDLVRTLLSRGEEARLGGALRPLTLLFTDVEGFTTVAERTEPAALVEALGQYLDVVARAVSGHRGTVDKFVGDGVVAFFNAPRDDAEHARNACLAAIAVQAALAERRGAWTAAGISPFRTRIGLHTADVIVGNLGTPERFSYTVVGDGVNVAARLESLNKAYGTRILASGATREAAGAGFEWREVDRTSVVGRAGATAVHELLGAVGAVDPALLAARDAYEAALRAHLARRFGEAVAGFGEARRLRPDDPAADALLARSVAFANRPPPPDWDGVSVQTSK